MDLHLFFVVSPWIFDATPLAGFSLPPASKLWGGFALPTWKRPNDTDTKRAEEKDMDPFLLYLRFWKNQRHFFLKKGCKVAWNLQSFFITVRNWISVELKPSAFRSWSENKWSDFSLPTFGHSISSIATRLCSWELDKKVKPPGGDVRQKEGQTLKNNLSQITSKQCFFLKRQFVSRLCSLRLHFS